MKKLKIILSVLVVTGIVLYGVYGLFFKRTPERLLKLTFDISLTDFDYTVESFEEQWYPNGDGHALIIINFNKLTKENIDYLKKFNPQPLPISEMYRLQMIPNAIPNQYWNADVGYYMYKPEPTIEDGNFNIFIVDTDKKVAVLYYQYM